MSDIAGVRVDPSGTGTLLATATAGTSGSTVTARIGTTVVTVQVARDLTVASGDVIIVQRVGQLWFALGRAWSAAPAAVTSEAEPAPAPATVSGVSVIGPAETRSHRPSGWRSETSVYQGEYGGWGNHTGCVFYDGRHRQLAGATVTAANIQVRRLTAGTYPAQTTTLRLMTNSTRPGGAPTLTSSTTGPALAVGATGVFGLPVSWVQAPGDGTAGGLGL